MKVIDILKLVPKIISKVRTIIWVLIKEKKFECTKIRYIWIKSAKHTRLVIFFSALDKDNNRRYHYLKSFDDINYDKLYILDPYGYRGSYWLYENGKDYPQSETMSFLSYILSQKKYSQVITAGTSKGGASSIFYGLAINADMIFAGACQYYIGTYVDTPAHKFIFQGMMGENASNKERDLLDEAMPRQIEKYRNAKSVVYIVYSKKEHTYDEHIKYLFSKFEEMGVNYKPIEYYFEKHSEVGHPFIEYVRKTLGSEMKSI